MVGPKYHPPSPSATATAPPAVYKESPTQFQDTDGWKVAQPQDAMLHGKWWEIYNDPELRRDLATRGHRFETRCDTEVIPHLYEEHGLGFVSRLNGMFAFAVFDMRENRLILGRDRAGEKPLYYLEQDGEVMFASEIKALLAHPRVNPQPDLRALTRYLLYGYFPAPHTPFAGVRKLPAGHLLIAESGRLRIEPYWDLKRIFRGGRAAVGEDAAPAGAPAARRNTVNRNINNSGCRIVCSGSGSSVGGKTERRPGRSAARAGADRFPAA